MRTKYLASVGLNLDSHNKRRWKKMSSLPLRNTVMETSYNILTKASQVSFSIVKIHKLNFNIFDELINHTSHQLTIFYHGKHNHYQIEMGNHTHSFQIDRL